MLGAMARKVLPVDDVLPRVVEAVREHRGCVLRAPTGAGKTTRVPGALLDGLALEGAVVMLEPRRLAARAAARTIARERGTALGDEVGYRVRFDDRSGPATRLLVVTDGILVRMLQSDPFLEGVGALVFDEFHERGLQADLALAMAKRVRSEARPELALVVMSATLDPAPIARYLDDAPVVESEGRHFAVEVTWLDPLEARQRTPPPLLAARHARESLRGGRGVGGGHVLVFLPGVGEIRRARDELTTTSLPNDAVVHELYGDLAPEAQDRVLLPDERVRKVILATNVAESSVTIEGVHTVIDTGLVKRFEHDAAVGLDRLRTQRVSRASADQRAGRAGRTGPGRCLRLWTEADDRALADEDVPEIARLDLASAVLELAAWGETDFAAFPWFEPPPADAVERARGLLALLGALDAKGGVTALGRELVRLPLHPRLGRLLVAGARRGVAAEAALAAAFVAERDPFRRRGRVDAPELVSDSDVVDRVNALLAFEATGATRGRLGEIVSGAARFTLRARDQLLRLAPRDERRPTAAAQRDAALRRALFEAYPDRLCRRRDHDPARGVLASGRGVRLADESAVREGELFCAVDLDAGRRESLVRLASGVDRAWLAASEVEEAVALVFDPERERVAALRRTSWHGLVLDERPAEIDDEAAASALLARQAAEQLESALDLESAPLASFLGRLRFLAEHCPELGLPRFERAELQALLPELCAGRRSFADLRRAPLLDHLQGRLTHEQRRTLEREAPVAVTVPSGSAIRLGYEDGRPPVLSARIQELFGLAATPRVALGRVPVLLHLLAPNMRPQQVTDDLASFWNGAYQTVRKELRRRYPKHAWPQDPWTATALRGARRRGDAR